MKISDKMLRQNAAQAREQWLNTLPQKDEIPDYSVSPAFQENMDRLLRRGRRVEKRKTFLRSFGQVAAVLLLVTAVSFAGLMTVDAAFREKVLQAVSQVFSDHTEYNYSGSQEDAALPELQLSDEQFQKLRRLIHCENDAGNCLDIDVSVIPENGVKTQLIDTEDAQVSVQELQGKEVTVVSKKGWLTLLWTEDSAVFNVFTDLELAELIPFIAGITNRP